MHDRLFDKLCDILEEIEQKPNLSASDIQLIDWITHAKKSMLATEEMMGGEYSNNYSSRRSYGSYNDGGSYRGSYDNMSYARGRGRNAKRDSMGRYAREGRSYRGYSRDAKEDFMNEMRSMMNEAPDDETRESIQRMISQMEQD